MIFPAINLHLLWGFEWIPNHVWLPKGIQPCHFLMCLKLERGLEFVDDNMKPIFCPSGRKGTSMACVAESASWGFCCFTELLIGGVEHLDYFSVQLGISSSQLTKSIIFQRGRSTTKQIRTPSELVGSPGDFGDACANSSLLEHCQTQGCWLRESVPCWKMTELVRWFS